MSESQAPKQIVIAALGSLGDLHPMLALALELQARGHRVTIASTAYYKNKVEALGIGFAALRPDWDPTDRELIAKCEDLRSGPEVLVRQLVLPHLRDIYEDLAAAATGADLMVAGELVFAAPLVAEKLGLRWVSGILSPTSFFSAYDPSLLANIPEVYRLRRAGWVVNRAILKFGKLASRHWWEPVRQLRREQGLRVKCDPLFKDKFSPELVLALFSPALAESQRDWPKQTLLPGFAFFDRGANGTEELPELEAFLAGGDAPIVFTLGSTAVHNPGNFYEASLEAVRRMGRRAVLLGAKGLSGVTSADVLVLPYAPHSQVFPRAAAVVHQGGSGTTGQALRAGRPQLIVPYGWDQPDNGERVVRLGVGLCVARSAYSATAAANALGRLLGDGRFAEKAAKVGKLVQGEDALRAACDAIELMLKSQTGSHPAPNGSERVFAARSKVG